MSPDEITQLLQTATVVAAGASFGAVGVQSGMSPIATIGTAFAAPVIGVGIAKAAEMSWRVIGGGER
jgi:hypothetical protein